MKDMKLVKGLEHGMDLPKHMAEHIYMHAGEGRLSPMFLLVPACYDFLLVFISQLCKISCAAGTVLVAFAIVPIEPSPWHIPIYVMVPFPIL